MTEELKPSFAKATDDLGAGPELTIDKLRGAINLIEKLKLDGEQRWRDFAREQNINTSEEIMIVSEQDFPDSLFNLPLPKWIKRTAFLESGYAYIIRDPGCVAALKAKDKR